MAAPNARQEREREDKVRFEKRRWLKREIESEKKEIKTKKGSWRNKNKSECIFDGEMDISFLA